MLPPFPFTPEPVPEPPMEEMADVIDTLPAAAESVTVPPLPPFLLVPVVVPPLVVNIPPIEILPAVLVSEIFPPSPALLLPREAPVVVSAAVMFIAPLVENVIWLPGFVPFVLEVDGVKSMAAFTAMVPLAFTVKVKTDAASVFVDITVFEKVTLPDPLAPELAVDIVILLVKSSVARVVELITISVCEAVRVMVLFGAVPPKVAPEVAAVLMVILLRLVCAAALKTIMFRMSNKPVLRKYF